MTVQTPVVDLEPEAPPAASMPTSAAPPWPTPASAWKTLWILSLVLGRR